MPDMSKAVRQQAAEKRQAVSRNSGKRETLEQAKEEIEEVIERWQLRRLAAQISNTFKKPALVPGGLFLKRQPALQFVFRGWLSLNILIRKYLF